jgi:hypothetical protein
MTQFAGNRQPEVALSEPPSMEKVANSEALTGIFGYWPSFHDAEVLSIHFDREGHTGYGGPTLETKVHVFEMTSEVNERGFYVLRHHTIVTLRFFQVDDLLAEGFNVQNVLWGMEITDASDAQMENVTFKVRFSSSFGLEMAFACKAVAVIAAEPHSPSA